MSIQPRTPETVSARSRTDHPNYLLVGIDTKDAHHVYRTTDETVHVIHDADRTCRYDLGTHNQRIYDWIEYVKAERGFTTQHLYSSLSSAFSNGDDQ
ncbi:hypothetical protein C491_15652 [Natronococcus amylolyticus DSM 10524]|uniref:Uncharacterized protein n=1 Tax=Natronococcus amylolyticus DSM 10524 TaxID=1227497 RepID=L9X1L7_9EURY|nr:hypothetical protein [Natronococcus amylolyticus]ELY55615.1 hypothetical protein C491_15652 [Natronococcus amylolyticus DSM 10524]